MQKFFVDNDAFENRTLTGEVYFQIKNVLRYQKKDQFLLGVNKRTWLVAIQEITSKEVFFEVLEEKNEEKELPVQVDLFQGYPKGDKLEDIIKYGTQLGIHSLTPVMMARTIVKLDESKKESKLRRFQKIAKEASEQSLRSIVPQIENISKLKQIDFSKYDVKIVCYEESAKENEKSLFKNALKSLKENQKIAVLVGPEGGITEEEILYLQNQGFICVGLGPRILRTETVVFYVLSAISYEWELK